MTSKAPTSRISDNNSARLMFNVSGQIFETKVKTLEQYPDTLLGDTIRREKLYCQETHQYYINRHHHSFQAVLFFYQSKGKLYRPEQCSLKYFLEECEYYELPFSAIHILKTKEMGYLHDEIRANHFPEKVENRTFRNKVWHFIENPGSSTLATCFFMLQIFAILLSIAISCLESYDGDDPTMNREKLATEIALSSWFCIEFTLRVIVSPDKFRFFKSVFNWIDLLAIAPHSIIYSNTRNREFGILREIRFIRVLRILRLRNISARTKSICIIFKDSIGDLTLFFFGLLVTVTLGGSVVYYIETSVSHNKQFSSIPESMWWAVQTFLTVGYGDIYPKSIPGRLFAALFMVLGMDTVLLPVLSLIMKFAEFISKDYMD